MVGTFADFLSQPENSSGKSELQKYSDALWLPKNGQEIVTDTPPLSAQELGISESMTPVQKLVALGKQLTDLSGRMNDAKSDKRGLSYLIEEFAPSASASKDQTVRLSKDAWKTMGADADNFAFGVKTIGSEEDFTKLQKDVSLASQYFDRVDVQRVTDQKSGKDVAIVVIMHDGEFIGADEFNAVIAAERKKEQLGQAVGRLRNEIGAVAFPNQEAAPERSALFSADRIAELAAKYPAKSEPAQQEAEAMSPRPVYTPGQQVPSGKGGRSA